MGWDEGLIVAKDTTKGTSHSCTKDPPRCNQENKMQQLCNLQEEKELPPQVVEHSMLCPCTQDELVDMSIRFRQKPWEPLPNVAFASLDMGVENIVILGSGPGRLLTLNHPSLQQRLQNTH